jgi:hypothetical protein
VLLVPNEEGALVCRDALANSLETGGKYLLELETTTDRLREICECVVVH